MKSNCEQVFKQEIETDKNVNVLLFSETDCLGSMVHVGEGIHNVQELNIKSFIVPENFKVRLRKASEGSSANYDNYLWGNYVTNVDLLNDFWRNDFGQEFLSPYTDISQLDVSYIGDRSILLASSCAGISDRPLPTYEPFTDGTLNLKCDTFMDMFCNSSSIYNREICQRREIRGHDNVKTLQELSKEIEDQQNLFATILYVVYGGVAIAAISLLIWTFYTTTKKRIKNRSTPFKGNKKNVL
jgi:hypothetical protein